jgi:hypothetical protein
VNDRVSKVDNGSEVELHRNYCDRSGWEAEGLSLVKSGYLIVREIKHPGTSSHIETLSANRSPSAQGIGGEDEARCSKECVAPRARGKLDNRRVQWRTGKHGLWRLEDLAPLQGQAATGFLDESRDCAEIAAHDQMLG